MRHQLFIRFWRDDSGATALEYGLICAFLFLAFAATLPFVANQVTGMFELIQTTWQSAVK